MEFVSSPIHNYTYETFDDGFFDIPKEMDFELNDECRENLSYNWDEDDDLNDGMYGVWNAKHPWSVNNNSNSLYNSNLHLDFIGGDPESAIMVNPNVVIPNGFQFKEENSIIEKTSSEDESKENILLETIVPDRSTLMKLELKDPLSDDLSDSFQLKKIKTKLITSRENIVDGECTRMDLSRNGIRVLKPTIVESRLPTHVLGNNQLKSKNTSRLKNSVNKNLNISKCSSYYQNDTFYPKPAFSYSCLITMALKNSKHGCLPVAEIYNFMCNHFPYFKTAPNGWKNSVRHNLSLNKCFEKIEKPAGSTQRKGCLWALNPSKAAKLEEEVQKCAKKDVIAIKKAMEYPEHLELLERGELKSLYDTEQLMEDEEEEDMDTNEEDAECEEPNKCEDDNANDSCSENDEPISKKLDDDQYPVLNINDTNDLPEFKIEVDDSIYEELIGSFKSEQLFTINGTQVESIAISPANSHKKIKKYFLQVNPETKKNEPEIFDHYDINNLLRFENENKITSIKKEPQRFVKRVCPGSRTKLIKFKNWD